VKINVIELTSRCSNLGKVAAVYLNMFQSKREAAWERSSFPRFEISALALLVKIHTL
jgi:hypothetical protein